MTEDGQLLLAYSRRGDVASLSALVTRHQVWLKAYLRGLLPSDSDVDDVFQDTWMRVIKSCGSFRGGSVRAYLTAIARSTLVDRYRRNGRPWVPLDAAVREGATVSDTVEDPALRPGEVAEIRATAEDIRRAVRTLPEGPREVLLMRIEGELSFKEIASVMRVPQGTALTWMHVATVRLRKMLGGER